MTTVTQANVYQQQQQKALYDMMNEAASGPPGAEGTEGTSAAGSGGDQPTYLTPEALMVYCQTRLQGIDSQVESAMTNQQNVNSEQTSVASILQELSTYQGQADGNGNLNSAAACTKVEQDLETLISQIQEKDPGCSQLSQLEQLHDSIMATGTGQILGHGYYCSSTNNSPGQPPNGTVPPASAPTGTKLGDNTLGTGDFTTFTAALTSINSNLGSGAEMGMINIQSLMSDRTTAIQLTTSILQSYDDGLSKIADNIGK